MRQLPLVTYEVCGSALLVLQLLLQNQIVASRTKSTVAANKPPIAAPSPPTPPPTRAPPIVGSTAASANTPSYPRLPAQAHSSRTGLVPRASAPSATPHPFYPNQLRRTPTHLLRYGSGKHCWRRPSAVDGACTSRSACVCARFVTATQLAGCYKERHVLTQTTSARQRHAARLRLR